MNTVDKHVGAKLAQARRAAGRTQAEVAAAVGITPDRLHRVEEGAERASAELLMLFCNELGIGPADIYRDLLIPHR